MHQKGNRTKAKGAGEQEPSEIFLYGRAVANTPVAHWVLIARGAAYSSRFPFVPNDDGLPRPVAALGVHIGRFEA